MKKKIVNGNFISIGADNIQIILHPCLKYGAAIGAIILPNMVLPLVRLKSSTS
jgi:hypothetical protein